MFIFIADTSSTSYVLDTGSNIRILKGIRQFKVFHPWNGNVEGIVGSNISIWGTGTTYILIKYDYETFEYMKVPDAVFIPLYPFNLLPPHIFIPAILNDGHKNNYSKHDDLKYILNYKLPSEGKDRWRKLTITTRKDKLFIMRNKKWYTSFFKRSPTYNPEWGNFTRKFHKTPEDDNVETPSDKPSQSHNNPRDLHSNPREVSLIPFQDEELEPLKTRPIPSDFNIQRYK